MVNTYPVLEATIKRLFGLTLSERQLQGFQTYYTVLQQANQQVNLVRIPDEATYIQRHVLDALMLLPFLMTLPTGLPIADVGSGGGIPLMILAIVRPDLQWHSIEATGKKVLCLQAMAEALGLSIRFHHRRMEDCNKLLPEHCYPVITARAVAPLEKLIPWVSPLLRPEGRLVAYKGKKAQQELADAKMVLKRNGMHILQMETWQTEPALQGATLLHLQKR
jgi:16S rRNA (guanine527-N7)-methyltransferase